MDERSGCALIYELAPKQAVRVVLEADGVGRSPLWLMVGKDSSLYFGIPRPTAWAKHGTAAVTRPGTAAVKYADGEHVSNRELLKTLHLSFHPSGAVNAVGQRRYIPEWRSLTQPRQLALILFEGLSSYPAVGGVRKRDILVDYRTEASCPLLARVLVAPAGSPVIVEDGAASQVVLVFEVTTTGSPSQFRLQVALFEGPSGPAPPATYVVFEGMSPNNAAEVSG